MLDFETASQFTELKFILFADTTILIASNHNINELVSQSNDELIKISTWLQYNKLFLNIDKTNYIIFHSRHKMIPTDIIKLKINNIKIVQINLPKNLGVIIDQNINWKTHTEQVALKISKTMSITRHIMKFINQNSPFRALFWTNSKR